MNRNTLLPFFCIFLLLLVLLIFFSFVFLHEAQKSPFAFRLSTVAKKEDRQGLKGGPILLGSEISSGLNLRTKI